MRIQLEEPDTLRTLGADAQARAVRSGQVRPRELASASLERIQRLDPALNCIRRTRDEAALAEADAVEAQVRAGEDPLLSLAAAVEADHHLDDHPTDRNVAP